MLKDETILCKYWVFFSNSSNFDCCPIFIFLSMLCMSLLSVVFFGHPERFQSVQDLKEFSSFMQNNYLRTFSNDISLALAIFATKK